MTDYEIILAVNALARRYHHEANPGKPALPSDYRCDLDRWQSVRSHFVRAAKDYLRQTGRDVRVALAAHERFLRNRDNAPELYVERR